LQAQLQDTNLSFLNAPDVSMLISRLAASEGDGNLLQSLSSLHASNNGLLATWSANSLSHNYPTPQQASKAAIELSLEKLQLQEILLELYHRQQRELLQKKRNELQQQHGMLQLAVPKYGINAVTCDAQSAPCMERFFTCPTFIPLANNKDTMSRS
jgi:hypothetical protein